MSTLDSVPLVLRAPLQSPLATQDVAFVVVQLTLAVLLPLSVAVRVAVGAAAGVTVAVRVTLPPGPVATSV